VRQRFQRSADHHPQKSLTGEAESVAEDGRKLVNDKRRGYFYHTLIALACFHRFKPRFESKYLRGRGGKKESEGRPWKCLFLATLASVTLLLVFFVISAEMTASSAKAWAHAPEPRCTDGPYVYDVNRHLEGIGSTFQHRKHGLILADALGGRWMGTLKNEHESPPRANHRSFFGLGGSGDQCEERDFRQRPIAFSSIEPRARIWQLCRIIHREEQAEFRELHNISRASVILLKGEGRVIEKWNYCLFNERFRRRFRDAQGQRGLEFTKGNNDTQVAVYFRWGDTAKWTRSVERPGRRNIWGLTTLAKFVKERVLVGENKNATINFISEGNASLFRKFSDIVPRANVRNDLTWQGAIDLMSQSDILIGGSSSFFVLSAHLCRNCTVVTKFIHPKFEMQGDEMSMASGHLQLCNDKNYKITCP